MSSLTKSTPSTKPAEVVRDWYVIDAEDVVLGRMATRIATVLRGKHKVTFTPHVDTGDFVIVINAHKVKLTGNKLADKHYHRYSGYFGGLKSTNAGDVRENNPERMFQSAIKGMLPKNRLGRQMLSKLKVYGGAEHPHAAQSPKPFPTYV
ncbi:MAG: 50S ribosomal protein L13 [Proteobacteria bacterium]|nr:50S ribosomal protein L13 [Pseudomonadota bacterium]MCP4921241.1 50S ribosomal protein L13 [Pseudomonadota bacterium]